MNSDLNAWPEISVSHVSGYCRKKISEAAWSLLIQDMLGTCYLVFTYNIFLNIL